MQIANKGQKETDRVKKQRLHNNLKEPIDFERAYVIGFNETYCTQSQDQDIDLYNFLNLESDQKRKIKGAKILASFDNPQKYKENYLDFQFTKQLETLIKLFAMPNGVKYQKYTDITQTLQ